MRKKAILIINRTVVGGAQKRALELFKHIRQQRNDYLLLLNKRLFIEFQKNHLLNDTNNVIIIDLGFKASFSRESGKNSLDGTEKSHKDKKFKKIRRLISKGISFVRRLRLWLYFASQFRKIQKNENIEVVYAVWTGGKFAWPLAKLFNFKLIYSYNDSEVASISSRNLLEVFGGTEYFAIKYADRIDFLSEQIINKLEEKIGSIENNKKLISPCSFVDHEKFVPLYPKENNVVFMHRLEEVKNPLLFLKSLKFYLDKYDTQGFNFYTAGFGHLEDEVIDFLQENKLKQVHFIGASFEPWKLLGKSKIFLSLQEFNNYPSRSLMEAMACENAIIASDVGETRKLVTENEGILVDLQVKEIAKALQQLTSNPELISKLGTNAREKVVKEQNIERYSEYICSISQ